MKLFERLKTSLVGRKPNVLESNDNSDFDPDNPFPDPVSIEITDVFDLHTIQPREVKLVVEEYLQQAHEKGLRTVRIIHGKGIGVQREMVRSILAKTPFVLDWTDAPEGAGGWGATIVKLGVKND
jgi:DNA-nicking Smr family endonuclease